MVLRKEQEQERTGGVGGVLGGSPRVWGGAVSYRDALAGGRPFIV